MTLHNDLFVEAFEQGLATAELRSPNYPREAWDVSGRKSAGAMSMSGGPDKRDEAWWRAYGPVMVERYAAWREETGWELAEFDGKPAVEVELNFEFPDGLWVGYIDRVFVMQDGSLLINDIKTGTMVPPTTGQLGLYACAIEHLYGVRPKWGNYWMPDKGPTEIVSLDKWTIPVLASMGADVRFLIDNDVFPPHPNMMCKSCSVRDACHVFGGENAVGNDPLATLQLVTA